VNNIKEDIDPRMKHAMFAIGDKDSMPIHDIEIAIERHAMKHVTFEIEHETIDLLSCVNKTLTIELYMSTPWSLIANSEHAIIEIAKYAIDEIESMHDK